MLLATFSSTFIVVTAVAGAVTSSRTLLLIAGVFIGLVLPLVASTWLGGGSKRRGVGRLWFVVGWDLALLLAVCIPFSDSAGRALKQRGDWFLGSSQGLMARGLRASVVRAGRMLECLDDRSGSGPCSKEAAAGVGDLDEPPVRRPDRPSTTPLEEPDDRRFDRFHARLSAAQSSSARLRITIFGDSHTAARVWPQQLERRLQRRFGAGGPGFVLRGRTWPAPDQLEGIDAGARRDGVIVDTLGLDGARASTLLAWDEPLMAASLRRLDPDLIVVAFGSNDLGGKAATWRRWVTSSFDRLLQRLQRVAPRASCLVLGPPDQARHRQGRGWTTPRRLAVVEAIQRRLALQRGCAFWSQRASMGGPGSILDWAQQDPPLAQQDHLHLTARGYRLMADRLHGALMARWAQRTSGRASRR